MKPSVKKKILISVTNDIAYDQRMQKTAYTLQKNGFEVHIVGRLKDGDSNIDLDSSIYTSHRFQMFFHRGKFFYFEYNLRLFFYLLIRNADIYCAVDLDTILPNYLVSKIKKKPLVYDAHEYYTEVPELEGRILEKSIWKWVEKLTLPSCRSIYTVSNSIALRFNSEYRKYIDVIYNYPLRSIRNNHIVKENVILYQGDLNEGRGLEIAISAMDNLDGWKLWIVGDGYHKGVLKELADGIQNTDSIEFLGRKTPAELKILTQKAKFGINLLENKGLNYYYSLANKFFDYIQAGVIPISMDFPEYRRIQDQYNCSILIPSLDKALYLKALEEVIDNENKYHDLHRNGDIAASFLTWENQEEKLSSIYSNV